MYGRYPGVFTSGPEYDLGLEAVSHAGGAGTHVARGQNLLRLAALADLGNSIDDTADETEEDGRDAAKGDGCVEENETADSDGKLVESTDHGIGGGRGNSDTPGGGVRDEDGAHAGDDHDHDHTVAELRREALGEVGGRPVFDEKGRSEEDGNGKKIVVVHGFCKVSVVEVSEREDTYCQSP